MKQDFCYSGARRLELQHRILVTWSCLIGGYRNPVLTLPGYRMFHEFLNINF